MYGAILTIDDKQYSLVRAQRDGESAVYTSGDTFLRLGNPKRIEAQLNLHKEMEKAGFPVSPVLAEGQFDEEPYYIEASLGQQHFGEIFKKDVLETGVISDGHFASFLTLMSQIGTAQLHTKQMVADRESFANGIKMEWICNELPEHTVALQKHFTESVERVSEFPFVLSHGDCNAHNLYPKGIIDLEDSFYGPFGYDLLTALLHADYMPLGDKYEHVAGYRFTEGQRAEYLAMVNEFSTTAGLSKLSDYINDFEFFRAVWLAVRMHKTPHLQKFRYDLLISKFLS